MVRRLVYRRGRPPNAGYEFNHALVQDAAYQSLPRRNATGLDVVSRTALRQVSSVLSGRGAGGAQGADKPIPGGDVAEWQGVRLPEPKLGLLLQ